MFAKLLEGEITPYSNQSYILSESFDSFYRFDSLQIGGRSCEKVVKGEIAALSFVDRETFPYFIRRAIGSQRHYHKRWQSVEEGVLSARVKVSLFEKTNYQTFASEDEIWKQKLSEICLLRQNIGRSRKFRPGSKLTVLLGAKKRGLMVMEVDQELGNGEWLLTIEGRSLAIENGENSKYLSKFAIFEGREFIGIGEVVDTDLG